MILKIATLKNFIDFFTKRYAIIYITYDNIHAPNTIKFHVKLKVL